MKQKDLQSLITPPKVGGEGPVGYYRVKAVNSWFNSGKPAEVFMRGFVIMLEIHVSLSFDGMKKPIYASNP